MVFAYLNCRVTVVSVLQQNVILFLLWRFSLSGKTWPLGHWGKRTVKVRGCFDSRMTALKPAINSERSLFLAESDSICNLNRRGELLISPSASSTVSLSWWAHRRTEEFRSVRIVSMCWGARGRRSGTRKGGRVESKTTASSVSSGNVDWRTERKWWWWCMCVIGKLGKKSEQSPEHAEAAFGFTQTQRKRKAAFYSTRLKMIFDHCESFMKLGASLHLREAAIGFVSVQAISFMSESSMLFVA